MARGLDALAEVRIFSRGASPETWQPAEQGPVTLTLQFWWQPTVFYPYILLKLSFLITRIRLMKRADLLKKLLEADRKSIWAFTPATFGALLGQMEPNYLKLMMKRLTDQGVLIRAARGVYVNPHARSTPTDLRSGLIRYLRPREISYVSLESRLSEVGVISQVATALTCMTTGSSGRFDTPWGAIEFTHTDRNIAIGTDVHQRDDGVLEASIECAVRDLRRVGRNTDLIDDEILADTLSEERQHEQQGHQP